MADKPKRGRPFVLGDGAAAHLHIRIEASVKAEIDSIARQIGTPASEIIRNGALKEARRLANKKSEATS